MNKLLHLGLKLAKSDTLKDSAFSTSGQFGAALLGAVFIALVARSLGLINFGIYSLSISTAVILKDVLDPAVNAALVKFIPLTQASDKGGVSRYLFSIKLLYYLVLLPLILVGSISISKLIFGEAMVALLLLTLVLSLSLSLATFISGMFYSRKLFRAEAIYAIGQPLLRMLMLLGLWATGYVNVYTVILIGVVTYFSGFILGLLYLGKDCLVGQIPDANKKSIKRFLPYFALSTATGTLNDRVNLFITNHMIGLSGVGVLSSLGQLFTPTKQIAGVVSNVLGTRFAAFSSKQQVDQYMKKALGLCVLMASVLVASSMLSRPIIMFIFGSEFESAIPVFFWFTLAYGLFILQVPFAAKLVYYLGRTDWAAIAAGVQLIASVVLNLALLPVYGIIGASYALVGVMFVYSLFVATASMFLEKRE